MKPRIIVPFLASLALCAAAAVAQEVPPPPSSPQAGQMGRWQMNKEDMARHMQQMCADRYAHAVGTMAYLQTRLALTDKQRPLFERWKDTVLTTAKEHSAKCAAMKMPEMPPTMVDRLKHQEAMLKDRLDSMEAQMPELEALTASLDQQQQQILQRTYRSLAVQHMRQAMGRRVVFMRRGGRPGPDGEMPPPPAP
ncbi:MAG: Spy/CpxP family protein refolding chaperone [Alphaproteobacteria bacterium]|nr:Spy/CpxP family protein refolding chaperone [Alphaproteobacteria bacterium]MDE2495163.1 Spy/CpxP family protein refolding chaperone [Alphaproteobacteria bacterium]